MGQILNANTPTLISSNIKQVGPYLFKYNITLSSPVTRFQVLTLLRLNAFEYNRYVYYKNKKNLIVPSSIIEFKTDEYKLNCTVQ